MGYEEKLQEDIQKLAEHEADEAESEYKQMCGELEHLRAENTKYHEAFDEIGAVLYPMHGTEHYGKTPTEKFCVIADLCKATLGEEWDKILQRVRNK